MTTHRERREARAERLRDWAEKREQKSDAAYEQASTMAAGVPFGQPILAGHYSEGRDRNYRNRISSTYDRAHEHAKKAESMTSRAAGIESQLEHSIYSDDPDAIEALQARIAELEAQRDRLKAFNASCRKGAPNPDLLDDRQRADLASITKHCPYQLGKGGALPGYALSNLGGNINRNRKRLEDLQRKAVQS